MCGEIDVMATGNLHHEIRRRDLHRAFIHQRHRGVQRIEDLLPLAPVGDHVVAPQQAKMMAHRRLRQVATPRRGK